jgi:hypothetical protein
MCAIFPGVVFQPEILGGRLYLFIYLFIYYSPCVFSMCFVISHGWTSKLIWPIYMCVCVCFFFPWVIFSFLLTLVDAVHGMFSF